MSQEIIALTGFIGAGKTEVAKILVRDYGYERVRFAGPLKAMLRALGCTEAEVDGDQKEVPSDLLCGITPRTAMQTLGTEWGRNCIHPGLWVNAWKHSIAGKAKVVVDDCRFPNEAEAVRELGGAIWRVERPGVGASEHASESQQLPMDTLLYNEGDLDILATKVREALAHLAGQRGEFDGEWELVDGRPPNLPGEAKLRVRVVGSPETEIRTTVAATRWDNGFMPKGIKLEWRLA